MKKDIFLIITILLIQTVFSCKSTGIEFSDSETVYDPSKLYSVSQLQEDFLLAKNYLDKKAIQLFTDKESFNDCVSGIEAKITKPMTELEFLRLLAPMVSELHCGHSFLSVSSGMENYMKNSGLFFPLKVRILLNRLFVIEDPHSTTLVPGTELLQINGTPCGEVLQYLSSRLTTDGWDKGRPRYDLERWFSAMYYTYIDNPEVFQLLVLRPGSNLSENITIPAVKDSALSKTAHGIIRDTLGAPYTGSIQEDYALLKIPVFSYSNPRAYKEFLQDFFSELYKNRIDTLILDLRGNYGGSPGPTVELFKYLIDKPLPFFAKDNPVYILPWMIPVKPAATAFTGDLYILMDEACFSMNSFLLSLIKYHSLGTLVGAQSAGGYICSDASRNLTLPNTGLRLRYSTAVFQTSVSGQEAGIGIKPDIPVEWKIEDFITGKDPVLKAALEAAGL